MNELWDKFDVMDAGKYQSFLRIDTTISGGSGQGYPDSQSNCKIL